MSIMKFKSKVINKSYQGSVLLQSNSLNDINKASFYILFFNKVAKNSIFPIKKDARKEAVTILKSPFVHKKSKESYVNFYYKAKFEFLFTNSSFLELFLYKLNDLKDFVDIKINFSKL